MRVIYERAPCGLLQQRGLAEEETEGVKPREEDARDDLADTGFTAAETPKALTERSTSARRDAHKRLQRGKLLYTGILVPSLQPGHRHAC